MNHERRRAGTWRCRCGRSLSCRRRLDSGRIARRAIAQEAGNAEKNQNNDGIESHARLPSSGYASRFF